jgi:hypothetical protein
MIIDELAPSADVFQFQEVVAGRERELPHRSVLGGGCCQMCGRPLERCDGGRSCYEYSDDEWNELQEMDR